MYLVIFIPMMKEKKNLNASKLIMVENIEGHLKYIRGNIVLDLKR